MLEARAAKVEATLANVMTILGKVVGGVHFIFSTASKEAKDDLSDISSVTANAVLQLDEELSSDSDGSLEEDEHYRALVVHRRQLRKKKIRRDKTELRTAINRCKNRQLKMRLIRQMNLANNPGRTASPDEDKFMRYYQENKDKPDFYTTAYESFDSDGAEEQEDQTTRVLDAPGDDCKDDVTPNDLQDAANKVLAALVQSDLAVWDTHRLFERGYLNEQIQAVTARYVQSRWWARCTW